MPHDAASARAAAASLTRINWRKQAGAWLKSALFSVPLGLKILGLALGVILLFGAVITYMSLVVLRANIDAFLEQESRFVAHELSYQVRDDLLINDLYGLTLLLQDTIKDRPDLRYAVVINPQRQVVAHTFGGGFPPDLLTDIAITPPSPDHSRRLLTSEGPLWEAQALISGGSEGVVRVGVSGSSLNQQVSRLIRAMVKATILIALVAVALALLLTWLITRPLTRLLQAAKAVQQGDYSMRLPIESDDEVGRLTEAFNAMLTSLGKAAQTRQENELLQRHFLQRVMDGQESERKRIARELHDQTGQALASVMVDLKMLENAKNEIETSQSINRLRRAITEEMGAIHDLAVALRPSVLDDLGLVPAVEMLVRGFINRQGIPVELTIIGFADNRADACTETCIYRIVQEALANVARHAQATEVNVILQWRGEKIRGVVEDNGIGFTPELVDPKNKLGVLGMRERIHLLQGSFRIESSPGDGAMLVFEVPAKAGICHEQ